MRLLRAPGGGVARDMLARGGGSAAPSSAWSGRPRATWHRDIHVQRVGRPWNPGVEVGSDLPQAIRHHRGHGVIRPVRARALRFKPKGSTRFIFRMRVGPVGPNRYLTRSLRAARRGGY